MPKHPPMGGFYFSEPGQYRSTALQDDRFADHARWIAIIISLWSVIEEELATIYQFSLKLEHKRGLIAFHAIQNYHAKRNTISTVIDEFYAGTNVQTEWVALQKDLKSAYNYRNTAAHGIWERHPRGPLRLRATVVDGTFIQKNVPYQAAAFKEQAKHISMLAARLNRLAVMLIPSPPSSR